MLPNLATQIDRTILEIYLYLSEGSMDPAREELALETFSIWLKDYFLLKIKAHYRERILIPLFLHLFNKYLLNSPLTHIINKSDVFYCLLSRLFFLSRLLTST